jgi:enamine deaminase RidA (YjgF/YER057c/UK114 family)
MSDVMSIVLRLQELGIVLPKPPQPAGNYSACTRVGNLLFISGQFPIGDEVLKYTGRIGAELSERDGYAAARLAALNVLAQIRLALGSLDHLEHLIRVEGHIASAPGWTDAPKVLDGASDLFTAVLGGRGRHTRTVFTPAQLPLNLAVELVVIAAAKPDPAP